MSVAYAQWRRRLVAVWSAWSWWRRSERSASVVRAWCWAWRRAWWSRVVRSESVVETQWYRSVDAVVHRKRSPRSHHDLEIVKSVVKSWWAWSNRGLVRWGHYELELRLWPHLTRPRFDHAHHDFSTLFTISRSWWERGESVVDRGTTASTLRYHCVSTTLLPRTTRLHHAPRHAPHRARTTLALRSLRPHHDHADHTTTKRRLRCVYATLIASPLRADHAATATVSRSHHALATLWHDQLLSNCRAVHIEMK